MKIFGYKNGKQIERSTEDLDYLELDIVKDFVRQFEDLEKNPEARIEVDFTQPESPDYNLVNCSEKFSETFYNKFYSKRKVKVSA